MEGDDVDAPYERQAIADWIVLVLVIVIVLGGLALSAYQIFKGPRYANALASAANASDTATGDGKAAPYLVTELKLSFQNIEVRSASIGFLILALSLAFFFLYLTFVYRVHATGT